MLYGMDDDDEFDDINSNSKINLKKVSIFIIILLVCFLIIFISFFISYKILNKDNQTYVATAENIVKENLVIDNVVEDNSYDDTVYQADSSSIENNTETINFEIPSHSIEKIEKKFIPQYNENAQNLIKEIYKSQEKQVYLTFDDGPSRDITPQILDILKENDVKATFFVLGSRVELYPDTLKREFNEGHYISNHGYSHQYSRIYENKDTVFQEYVDCENAIKNALNNQDYNSYLFRFPGGSSGGKYERIKSEARELLTSYGVAYTNWNCLTGDAAGKNTKEECIEEMLQTKGEQNSIILLMHDANDKAQTVEALPEIIQYFKNEGYTFKNFYEIFK